MFSSLIQTILSVPELHRFSHLTWVADYTAGGELRPAPKNPYLFFLNYIALAFVAQDAISTSKSYLACAVPASWF